MSRMSAKSVVGEKDLRCRQIAPIPGFMGRCATALAPWRRLVPLVAAAFAQHAAHAYLEKATPESQGVPSSAIGKYIDACEAQLDGMHSFVLVRHGKLIAEGYWAPFSADRVHLLYSHSKSFTSTAAGFLVDDGKLDLDERVVDIFPEYEPTNAAKYLAEIRVRDLLTMNAGQDVEAHYKDPAGDWVRAFLNNGIERRPGTSFKYDSCATHIVAAVVEKKSGKRLMDFLGERLFSKVGIEGARSNTSSTGVACGGWGMSMKTRDLAKFGLLYLNEGEWNGERILSRDWVRLATSKQTSTDRKGDGDWSQGYGFQFWRCRHNCYRADGAFGQYTVVMPEKDAVISITAGLSDMGKELQLVWDHLLPAMKDAPLPEDAAASAALEKRCRELAIPPVIGTASPSDSPAGEKSLGARFALEGEQKRFFFKEVSLSKGNGGWEIALVDECGPQKIPVGAAKWEFGEMEVSKCRYEAIGSLPGVQNTAASGAWIAPDTFYAKVFLVDTPWWFGLTFKFNADGTLDFTVKLFGWGGNDTKLAGSRI